MRVPPSCSGIALRAIYPLSVGIEWRLCNLPMMHSRNTFYFLVPCALFFAHTLYADDSDTSADLSHYPQTRMFKWIIEAHAKGSAVLVISSLLDAGGSRHNYYVNQSGREEDDILTNDGGDGSVVSGRGSEEKQFSADDLKNLRSAIKGLPSGDVYPPMEHLVVVSFHDGATWVTRTYDQTKPPDALKRIYDVIASVKQVDYAAEAKASMKKLVADARASVPKYPPIADVKTEDIVLKCATVVVGNIRALQGPTDAQFGQARYYGIVDVSEVLRGSPKPPTVIAINAPLLASFNENGPNIYFLDEGNRFGGTVGAQYTALKFLPANDANIAYVKKLIAAGSASK
jgi:hypothetical protein